MQLTLGIVKMDVQRFKIERYIFPSQQVDEVKHTIGKVWFGNTTHRFTFFLTGSDRLNLENCAKWSNCKEEVTKEHLNLMGIRID
jgi:hypothetical protein